MEIKDTYITIEDNAEGLFKDKGSKFIAYAYPVNSEQEVKAHIQTLKKEHYSARHHCYAFRIGHTGDFYRAGDDGEPSGTAGRPILGQLRSNDLTNTLIVVVRYFGGTLLGVGGLINAYKNASAEVINNATLVERIIEEEYKLIFDYQIQSQVMRVIKDFDLTIKSSDYQMKCTLVVAIRLNIEEKAINILKKIEWLTIEKVEL